MSNIQNLIQASGGIINTLIKLGVGAGLLVFLWGLAMYVFKSSDPGSEKEGKNRMIWGLIALFVMMSVWGIVSVISYDLLGNGAIQNDDNVFKNYNPPCGYDEEHPC
jgi:hypothetical protein